MPVWHPSLTGDDWLKIERVQKAALSIILGEGYQSYKTALRACNVEKLFSRRQNLCRKFAKKSLKHGKFSKWFKPNPKVTITRVDSVSSIQGLPDMKRVP